MKSDERRSATSRLSRAAKESMTEWKAQHGIKAIVPKTQNQLVEMKRTRSRAKVRDRDEMRKMSHGAASEVRYLKPEDLT